MLPLLSALLPKALDIVDQFIPDKDAAAKAKAEMEMKLVEAANAANMAQLQTNIAEAQHKSVFVAGWRPAIGWLCAFGLGWQFVGNEMVKWVIAINHLNVVPPSISTEGLMELTFAMLGMAGLRTFEKMKGVTK
jgi:hypothetical protein